MNARLPLMLIALCAPCWAQAQAITPARAASAAAEPPDRNEPVVKHTIIEDEGSKIDELKVRGQIQHVVVTPKVGVTKPYEIITPPGGRGACAAGAVERIAAGKRVWNVLKF